MPPARSDKTVDDSSAGYWLRTAGDDLSPRPSLSGEVEADVAIMGAGFTGLWTAYYLLQRNPGLRVVLVDAEIAGFGGSGRNGAWLSSGFPVSPGRLKQRYGREAARNQLIALAETVDEVDGVVAREHIDIQLRRGGVLRVARRDHQVPDIRAANRAYRDLGLEDRYSLLGPDEVAQRVRVAHARGGLYTPDGAVIHPGRLVRGLARLVERLGATIFEQSRVVSYTANPHPSLATRNGRVGARVIVLAGEAYQTGLKPLHRRLLPLFSQIVLTEPLSSQQWAEIGWAGQECIASTRFTVDYLSRTADGRILFGSRGAPYRYASKIDPAGRIDSATDIMIKRMLLDWFPMLKSIRFTHGWGGVVGMPRDWMPAATFDRRTGVAWAGGYTGQGVATSNLAARILADLIQEVESPLTHLPMANHRGRNWEPEPLRWLAARYVQRGLERLDLTAERTGRRPHRRTMAERLAQH